MSSTLLGDALVDIDMLEANAPREIWVPLHNGTGQVALTLTWRPKNIGPNSDALSFMCF